MCPDKGDGTLDDVCFRGSEEECEKWFNEHYITDDENIEKFSEWLNNEE
jgi:hypothetical protein